MQRSNVIRSQGSNGEADEGRSGREERRMAARKLKGSRPDRHSACSGYAVAVARARATGRLALADLGISAIRGCWRMKSRAKPPTWHHPIDLVRQHIIRPDRPPTQRSSPAPLSHQTVEDASQTCSTQKLRRVRRPRAARRPSSDLPGLAIAAHARTSSLVQPDVT